MRKVLVIDDEIDICETIRSFFGKRGYEVIYALTGQGGLDAFEAEEPDVVILDLCLGDMWGMDIIIEVKHRKPACGVIVITGSASEDDRNEAIRLGVDYYLSKPFSIEMLSTMTSRLV